MYVNFSSDASEARMHSAVYKLHDMILCVYLAGFIIVLTSPVNMFFLVFSLSSFTYSHCLAGKIFKALAVDCVWLCAMRYAFFYFLTLSLPYMTEISVAIRQWT